MATITFDNHRQATITIENIGNDISFLMSPVFDNSESNLLRDIEICDSEEMKRLLISFYEHIKAIGGHIEIADEDDIASELSLEFEPGNAGDWCAVVHNIKPEHSGYWYAVQNLEAEKYSLIKLRHELEGIKIAMENIDIAITIIKNADSQNEAAAKLMDLGLDMEQAKAFMRINIANLASYKPTAISNALEECGQWTKFIENLTRN